MTTGTSDIHVSHRTWPACVFRSEINQIEVRRADKVVHFPIEMTASGNMGPNRSEAVLPALDPWLGRKPMFDEEQRAVRLENPSHLA